MERVIYILCFFLLSCSPAKKLSRLVDKYPHLIQNVDTTIYFTTNSVDTSFIFNNYSKVDTFYIAKTNTTIYRHFDTLRVETQPRIDSVIITKQIFNVDKKEDKGMNILIKLVILLICLSIISLSFTKPR
jgi:ABC-type transport system involved in multi-copper enzyme maturation permease subunit